MLLASGLIVGESILGVIFAAVVAFSGSASPIALVGKGLAAPAMALGAIVSVAAIATLYRWIAHVAHDRVATFK